MSKTDLRLEYRRDTGKYPNGSITSVTQITTNEDLDEYVKWLEEELLKHKRLKNKLLPWEKL